MANHRKVNGRRLPLKRKELVYFVRSLFTALDMGIVTWPKFLGPFLNHIRKAYAGDLQPLTNLVNTVSHRGDNVRFNDLDSEILIKWKQGMLGKYVAEYEALKRIHKLLTEYWRLKHVVANSVSKITFGKDSFVYNQKLCLSWQTPCDHTKVIARQEI